MYTYLTRCYFFNPISVLALLYNKSITIVLLHHVRKASSNIVNREIFMSANFHDIETRELMNLP